MYKEFILKLIKYEEVVKNVENIMAFKQIDAEAEAVANEENVEKYLQGVIVDTNNNNPDITAVTEKIKTMRDGKKIVDTLVDFLSQDKSITNMLDKNHKLILETLEGIEKSISNNNNNKASFLETNSNTLIQISPDAEPPKPYTSSDILCKNSGECLGKKLTLMKCTVVRVTIRTAYEAMNVPLLTMAKIIYKACSCDGSPSGDQLTISCKTTKGQPGIPCVIPLQVYKPMYKMSFETWKAYQTASHTCFNPITPY